jgi:hypothetical protein
MFRHAETPVGWLRAGPLPALLLLSGISAATCWACKNEKHEVQPRVVEAPVERVVEDETGKQVAVQVSPQGVVVKSKDKDSVRLDTSSGKPPEDWPSEVPLYPGAKINMSMKLGRGFTLTLETQDTAAKVAEFYKAQLSSLQQQNSVDLGKGQTLVWSDDKKPLQVTLALSAPQPDRATRATLIVSQERQRSASR